MAAMTYTSFMCIGERLWQTDMMMSRFWFGQEVLVSRANNVAIGIRRHNIQWYNCTVEVTHRILLAKGKI